MTDKPDDFVHLHLHSDMSQLDGAGKIPEYVQEAKRRGNRAIAFTDHGTMRGYMAQHEACKELDIKPIYGCEFYVSPNMRRHGLTDDEKAEITKGLSKMDKSKAIKQYEEVHGIRDRWHTTVWACNQAGLKNLYKLTSAAFIDGFYYRPRIDVDELIKYGEGLHVSTGCLSSPINDMTLNGRRKGAFEFADKLQEAFGERMWLEIQPHAIADQRVANEMMLKLRDRYDGQNKLLATQDAHYVRREDAPHHEVLLCIGTGSNLSDPERFKFDGDEFYMKTRSEMRETFRRHHEYIPSQLLKEALNSTLELSESCKAAVEVDYHKALLPDPGLPDGYTDHFAFLKDLCIQGWTWRGIAKRAKVYAAREGITPAAAIEVYRARLHHELRALKKQKFVPYFLIVRDIYQFARSAGIMFGPGRGSVGGSLVAYLLGFTIVDPIEHGLIFERFINPFRYDMPDVDMDFEDTRRHEIIEYLVRRYGREHVAQIATIGKLSGKQCLTDVARVLEVPLMEVRKVTASIIERSSGDERASQTIADSFKEFEVCRQFNEKYPKVLEHATRLEGLAKNLGIHAAGVVTSPVPLTEVIPIETRNHNGERVRVTALDMYGAAACGLVKLDVLGLRTLTVIKNCLAMIKERHGVEIDLESTDFDLNDPKALEGFTKHDYGGVFQYDTPSADKVCQGVTFTSFEDVAAMTALNRPGTSRSGLATKYVERKKNPALVAKVDFHPSVSKITSDTLGIIVYQEHVIKIFTDCAGFAPGSADSLRKTIAKKIGDETLGKERQAFVEGCKEHSGIDEKTANKIMDAITFFGCVPEGTEVLTPSGPRPIEDLEAGDRIYSIASDGAAVENQIKAVGPSGEKAVYRILTNHVEAVASSEHWWLVRGSDGSHSYKKTRDLVNGDLIGYATNLKHVAGEKPDLQDDDEDLCEVREGGLLSGSVSGALPARISGEADSFGESGVQRAQQERRSARQGLEGGEVEGNLFGNGRPVQSSVRRVESGLGRREDPGLSRSAKGSVVPSQDLPKVRRSSRFEPSGAEYENPSHSPQGPQQKEQQDRESGGDLPILPLEGALGGKVSWSPVIDVSGVGSASTYDLECESAPANYVLANGLVSHNSYGFNKSHATEYGMIAYWGMWLKTYYPIEFYWALLKNEPDRIRIQQLSKDAKGHGIALLPPHVNVSRAQFSIDGDAHAIRGSLVDIKGVGEKAAEAIIEAQPFASFDDFLDRVDRKRVHKGVVVSLARAGALDGMLPNTKWFVEHVDELWGQLGKKPKKPKKGETAPALSPREAFWDAGKAESDYTEEERMVVTASVNPLAFGKHPIDAYEKFMAKAVDVPVEVMGEETYFKDFDGKGHYIAGVIVEVKYNQIGDFHTGELPSEEERRQQFWGRRYANVNIEERSGKQNRVKFDHHIFDRFRPLIDKGIGTPVIAHVTASEFTGTLRANFAVDIEDYRQRLRGSGADYSPTLWESLVKGAHPALSYEWRDADARAERIANKKFAGSKVGGVFCGVVTHVQPKYDKRGGLMAIFGLLGADGRYISVMCWASVWENVEDLIKAGRLLKIAIEKKPDMRSKGWAYFYNGGHIKWLKKATSALALTAEGR